MHPVKWIKVWWHCLIRLSGAHRMCTLTTTVRSDFCSCGYWP